MSRYNPPWWEVARPFYDLFFLVVVVPLFVLGYCLLRLLYGKRKAEQMIDAWLDDGVTGQEVAGGDDDGG